MKWLTVVLFVPALLSAAPGLRFLEIPADHPSNRPLDVDEADGWRRAPLADLWVRFFTNRALEKIEEFENDGFRHLHVQLIDAAVEPVDQGLHYKLKFVVGKTNCLRTDTICDYLNVVSRRVYVADVQYDYETRQDNIYLEPEGDEIY